MLLNNLQEIVEIVKKFFLSTNFYIAISIFIVIFILTRKLLRIIQWLVGLIVTFWFTIMIIYLLVKSGLMESIVNFIDRFIKNFSL